MALTWLSEQKGYKSADRKGASEERTNFFSADYLLENKMYNFFIVIFILKTTYYVLNNIVLYLKWGHFGCELVFTCVYVIQQQGSTWLASKPQYSNSSSKSGPQTSVG